MFVRPGQSIRDYLSGKRKDHFKPIGYVLILSTFYFLMTKLTGQATWLEDFFYGWVDFKIGPEGEAYIPSVLTWAAKNYAYVSLLLIPIYALATKISFYKEKQNYIEHIILNAYITGQQAIIYSVFPILMYFVDSDYIEAFPLFFVIGYNYFALNKFFRQSSWVKNALRILLSYLIYGALFIILFTIAVVISTYTATGGF